MEALLEKLKHTVGKLQNATRTKDPVKFLYFVKEMQGILSEIGDKLELKNPAWLRTCVDQVLKDYLYPQSQKNEQRVLKLFRNVEDLNLSVRSMNCLHKENINYIIDLVRMGELDLLRIPNFGRKSLTVIKQKLAQIGLRLGMQIQGLHSNDIDEAMKSLARSVEEQATQSIAERDYRGELYFEPIKVNQETFVKLLRRVDELDLSVRSANCLRDLKVIYLGDLVHKKEYELLRTRNFGCRSLSELKEKLEEIGLSLGMNVARWPPQNMKETLQHFALKLEQERTREAKELRQRLEAKIENIEDELLHHLSSLTGSKRNTQIVSEYFGWDGQGTRTLAAIGRQYGISRERVRQICVKFEKRFRRRRKSIHLPIFSSALKFVMERLPGRADDIESEIAKQGISKGIFRIEGLLTVTELLGRKVPLHIAKVRGARFVVQPSAKKLPKLILQLSKKSIEHWGVATVSDIAAQVSHKIKQSVDYNFAIAVLSLFEDLCWLDESNGWFWLSSVPRNRLLNRIQKILSVAHSIDVGELRAGISRCSRMEGFVPPRRVLLELCQQASWSQVSGTTIVADPPFDWEDILAGTTEWAMAAVLKEYGPVMSRRAFEKRCLELGMKENTFFQYLAYSPIITKYAIGVYGLRGSIIQPGIVESLKPKRKLEKVLTDYSWTSDGKIWLGHQVSHGMIQVGVFSIPAAMRQYLQGDFTLQAADGSYIGNLKVKNGSAWTLRGFFQRRGGEPGDFLVLTFDLNSREAKAYIGDKDLIDDFRSSG